MNYSRTLFLARKPRADIIQFLLSVGLESSPADTAQTISLDKVVREFMMYGPTHSSAQPFPDEEDLAAAMVWLQRNGYLFVSGDDCVSLNKEQASRSSFSAHLLFNAVQGALDRLNVSQPSLQHAM